MKNVLEKESCHRFQFNNESKLVEKVHQTEARKILKDAPIMWRRINSIGIILDCNSTYAAKLGFAKSEIIGIME